MIKKILGNAPFDISCGQAVLVPGKTKNIDFRLSNDTEYDLPLKFVLSFSSTVKSDLSEFNVVVPAGGNTKKTLKLDVDRNDKIFFSEHLCEIKIHDGVLNSESDYEIAFPCEMAYKCTDKENNFTATNEVYFTSEGTFFANSNECICLEIPLAEQMIISTEKNQTETRTMLDGVQVNSREIKLHPGLNKLCIKMFCDGKIEFFDTESMQKIFLNTINPMYFLED